VAIVGDSDPSAAASKPSYHRLQENPKRMTSSDLFRPIINQKSLFKLLRYPSALLKSEVPFVTKNVP
jgi:hypothetical protein